MKNKPYKFTDLNAARSFVARCEKAHAILMGDDSKFWVVTLADMDRGLRLGYEVIK